MRDSDSELSEISVYEVDVDHGDADKHDTRASQPIIIENVQRKKKKKKK